MSGKKSERRTVKTRSRGGATRAVDMSPELVDGQPVFELSALAAHVTAACFQLTVEYDWVFQQLGLRPVELDNLISEFISQIKDGQLSETHLIKCFDGVVLSPLRGLCQAMTELQAAALESEQSQTRLLMRQAASKDTSSFAKMLYAFERKIDEVTSLNEQDAAGRQALSQLLAQTNQCVARGLHQKSIITGHQLASGAKQPGLEQMLSELVRQTARDLVDDQSALHTKAGLDKRWEQLDRGFARYQQTKKAFSLAREEYDAKARQFYTEYEMIGLYKGEWHRQKEVIRYAEEFFKAAGLDPFQLSDKLAGVDRQTVLTMPDQDQRAELEAHVPDPFPQLPDSRLEERVHNTIDEIVEAIDGLERTVVASEQPKPCPVTWLELALCTYAAFVARYANGKPYPTSGRTIHKVYDAMLIPAGLTFGLTKEQFTAAVQEAEAAGLVQSFKLKLRTVTSRFTCYQPTAAGFRQAQELFAKLPADFSQRVFNRHEALREEASSFRQQKRKQS